MLHFVFLTKDGNTRYTSSVGYTRFPHIQLILTASVLSSPLSPFACKTFDFSVEISNARNFKTGQFTERSIEYNSFGQFVLRYKCKKANSFVFFFFFFVVVLIFLFSQTRDMKFLKFPATIVYESPTSV